MGLIEKIENLINKLLFLIWDLFVGVVKKIVPVKIQNALNSVVDKAGQAVVWLKGSPKLLIKNLPLIIAKIKELISAFDFKAKLKETHQLALAQYSKSQDAASSGFKRMLIMPFLMFGQWLKGLTLGQGFTLLGFTSASVVAVIAIFFSGNTLVTHHQKQRAPASVVKEEVVAYERPDYYKEHVKHFDVTGLRLPVYFPQVNELRSIDVDFTATISNREARAQLEKLEFQMRDHLILQVEPMVAAFPLEEEGKDILRDKLRREINDFMKANHINGEVKTLKLTYILAN